MSDPAAKPSLSDLEQDVVDAEKALENAMSMARQASHEETEARNRFNRATKALDKRIAEMRENAPRNTDWHREARRPVKAGA